MSGECCRVYTLTVKIQENGIIRDPFGFIMGRCDDEWLRRMTNQPPYRRWSIPDVLRRQK